MKKIIALFIIFLISSSNYSQEKRLALVIGNANYDKGALENPVNDAKLIAKTLDSLDFEVILATNIEDFRSLQNKIREFGNKRKDYDVGFVYYAGHGVQIDGENYLLPTKEIYESEDDITYNAVNVDKIMKYLTGMTDQVNILVLDACRDNTFESNWNKTRSLKGKGLAKIPAPTGSLIAFSTSAGNTAADGDGENSLYSTSLAKNMLLKDTSLDQVFRNVRADVLSLTNNVQRPIEASQLTGDAYYLVKRNFDKELKQAALMISEDKIDEAIYLLETIYKSEPNNLEIVSLLSKSYTINGNFNNSSVFSQKEYEKANKLLNKYIPSQIDKEIMKEDVSYSIKRAYLYYRKSRLLFFWKSNVDWNQVFLNIEMSIKHDPFNPYWDYYYATVYFEQFDGVSDDERKLLATNRYNIAIEKYLKKIDEEKNNPELYFYLGFSYYNNGKLEKAYENWTKASELDPQNIFYYRFISNKYLLEGKYNEANKITSKAISICNDCSVFYEIRGNINLKLDNWEKAIDDYTMYYNLSDNKLFKNLKTKRGWAILYKGKTEAENNKTGLAFESYKKAIKDFDFTINFIVQNQLNKKTILDLKNIQDSIIREQLIELITYRADAYFSMAATENDLELDYTISLQLSKNDYKILIDSDLYGDEIKFIDQYLRADYLSGNYDDLIKNANIIINMHSDKLKPNELSEIYTSIGMTYWTINDNLNALKYYKKALDLNPSTQNYDQYAVTLFETGDYENALIFFNKTLELAPNETVYLHNRGMYYYETGDYKKAEKDFLKSIKFSEYFDVDDYLMLMKINVKRNNYEKQLFYANKILEFKNDLFSNYWVSEIYLNQKRYLKSIIFISKVIDIKKSNDIFLVSYNDYDNTNPKDSEIITLSDLYLKRGDLFKIIGNYLEACEDYNTVLSLIKDDTQLKKEIEALISNNCN